MVPMTGEREPTRRSYLTVLGAGGAVALAGCTGGDGDGGASTDTDDGTTDSEDGPDSVAIGSDIPYRPFEYRTVEGDLVGFDVEIAEAVFGDELGIEPEFQQTGFDGIISSLNNGNFRVIMSAMTINDERAERVDFSDPYFTAYQTIVVLEDSGITGQEDLRGRSVAVQKGTTGEGAAESLQEEFGGELTIESYDQITGAFDALLNNQVVAVINDNTVNAEFAAENDEVRFVEGEGAATGEDAPDYLTLTVEEYGIAFRQDDDDFREEVNDALAAVMDDGTYDEIYAEYFGPGG